MDRSAQKTQSKPAALPWMSIAIGMGLVLALAVLAATGTGVDSLVTAIRLSARWSFLLFWMAYCGSALSALLGRAFAPMARHAREFGLAYAAAQLVHLGLVAWLFRISPRQPISNSMIVFFSIGIFWTYLLALLSFGNLAEALGPIAWRAVRITGMNYILFAFGLDFVRPIMHPEAAHYTIVHLISYVPFAAMSIAAPLLVLASAARYRMTIRYSHGEFGPAVNRVN
jgi:hypothetical protein